MKIIYKIFVFFIPALIGLSGCKKFIEVEAPVTSINALNVYSNDATAASVLTGIYGKMARGIHPNSELPGVSIMAGLSADELALFTNTDEYYLYYTNALNTLVRFISFWNPMYNYIFTANSAIEGLNNSTTLTPAVKQQLLGEAKFIRALSYFYLVNLYGDVPLVLTTDFKVNSLLPRAAKADIYQQILTDLNEAQELLSNNYLMSDALSSYPISSAERVRPTRWAAKALLARVYLYRGEYAKAEAEATAVINNTSMFSLTTLANVFKKNSTESIWSLQPVRIGTNANTGEGALFILPTVGPGSLQPVYLSNFLLNSFETDDQRRTNWVSSVTPTSPGNITYHYAYKYKIGQVLSSVQEYTIVLRLAEQYLIRAEARAQQNKTTEAQADLNMIRTRAGLPNTTAADKNSLLSAILHERQVELFTEWGDRWLELKRTGNIDAVMNIVTPQKGGTWSPHKALFPIPDADIIANPNLTQNPGY